MGWSPLFEKSHILEVRTASWSKPLAGGQTRIPHTGPVMARLGGSGTGSNAVPIELPEGICKVVTLFCLVKGDFLLLLFVL